MDESIGEECKPGSKDIIVMVDKSMIDKMKHFGVTTYEFEVKSDDQSILKLLKFINSLKEKLKLNTTEGCNEKAFYYYKEKNEMECANHDVQLKSKSAKKKKKLKNFRDKADLKIKQLKDIDFAISCIYTTFSLIKLNNDIILLNKNMTDMKYEIEEQTLLINRKINEYTNSKSEFNLFDNEIDTLQKLLDNTTK